MNPLNSWLDFFPSGLIGVVALVGVILALSRWSRHPNVSLLALIGFGLLLLSNVGGYVLQRWVFMNRVGDAEAFRTQLRLLSLGRMLFTGASYVCLIIAVFGWRARRWPARDDEDRPPRRSEYDDDYGERRPPPSDDIRQARY